MGFPIIREIGRVSIENVVFKVSLNVFCLRLLQTDRVKQPPFSLILNEKLFTEDELFFLRGSVIKTYLFFYI